MWAASENHPAAAKLLIEHGAEVNARTTELTYAKDRFGLEGVVTVALPHGSWTPLMYAPRAKVPSERLECSPTMAPA